MGEFFKQPNLSSSFCFCIIWMNKTRLATNIPMATNKSQLKIPSYWYFNDKSISNADDNIIHMMLLKR